VTVHLGEDNIDPLVQEAQDRGYLTIEGSRIFYHCSREFSDNYDDPEEKVRARTYSWLILRRSYAPSRIDLEVTVPRRTPSDFADIVLYQDDSLQNPYLVVENKEEQANRREQRQGIEQGFGNANSLRAPYLLFDYGRDSVFYDVGNFPPVERQRNRLGQRESIPAGYGEPGRFPIIAQGATDIAPVSAPELEMKVRRAHGLLWAGGRRDPLKAFDEWSKLLFAKIYDERHTPNGEPRKFQVGVRETDAEVADRVRNLFADAKRRDPSIFSESVIDLPDNKIRDVVQTIQEVGLSLMPIDGLGHAFEHFFSTIFRGDLGQYFTRRELVRFMVAMAEPDGQDFVIDPTCGSGGFLLEALMQVWRYIDTNFAGQTDVERQKYDFAHENLFGIEANDILGRVCQTNLLLHKDGHINIETNRSCLDVSFGNPQIRPDGTLFTLVLGNPPFGSDVEEGDDDDLGSNTLEAFELGRGRQKIKSELVILDRSFQFLRPGGRLAMVIPDGLLNNAGGESRVFRRYLMHTARIDAVVSLPDHAFRKSGAQNKTSILFATKFTEDERSQFQRAYAEEVNRLTQANKAQPQLGNGASTAVELESTDDDSELSADERLIGLEVPARAMQAVLRRSDYYVFLAEADQIGYSPAGAPIADNDLYSVVHDTPDAQDENSILRTVREGLSA
jgi:type I restriction enzyme M protein